MPFIAPLLRTTLLLSSVTLAASYALYENNEAFRNFVDATVDRILAAWDHVLATLSPEERERQRAAQRREVLVALSSRGDASGVPSVFSQTSGTDASGADGRARRRRLFEMAERNAAAIGTGIGDIAAGLEGRPTLYSQSQVRNGGAESAFAPDPPEVTLDDSQAPAQPPRPMRSIAIQSADEQRDTAIPITLENNSQAAQDDDAVSVSGTSTASMSSYSNILTPTSSNADDPFVSAAEGSSQTRSRTASLRSVSTETMSHFTQSVPPSVVDEDDAASWDRMSMDEDGRSVSEVDVEGEDPSSAAAWEEYRSQHGPGQL